MFGFSLLCCCAAFAVWKEPLPVRTDEPVVWEQVRSEEPTVAAAERVVETKCALQHAEVEECINRTTFAAEMWLELDRIRQEIQLEREHVQECIKMASIAIVFVVAVFFKVTIQVVKKFTSSTAPTIYMNGRVPDECIVCTEKIAIVYASRTCGHACMCLTCIDRLSKCPVCCAQINGKICINL